MENIVASNALLHWAAQNVLSLLNSGHVLRLFANDLDPTPANVLADFAEASFAGYVPIVLSGLFTGPSKVQDGTYQVSLADQSFGGITGANQYVHGWFIDDGTNVKISARFLAPILVTAGVRFTVALDPQDWALSILP